MRYCASPGCPAIVPLGHCARHARQREAGRPNADVRQWYRKPIWKALRRRVLLEAPLCRHCESRGEITFATDVDHIAPHRGQWDLFVDYGNLQPLCASCHSRKTQRGE